MVHLSGCSAVSCQLTVYTKFRTPSFLAYRMSRLLVALVMFLFAAVLASNVLVFQAQVVLTAGIFVTVVVSFLALYWAQVEFEYIYKTYLWLWGPSQKRAEEGFLKYKNKSVAIEVNPQPKKDVTPQTDSRC